MNPEVLSQRFDEDIFIKITDSLIKHDFKNDTRQIAKADSSKYITEIKNLGKYEDLDLQLLTVKHTGINDARVGLSKELFNVLKNYSINNALIATYSSDGYWRYSLLTTTMKIDKNGKVIREFSSPKRHSFLLGPNAKTNTPYKYLVKKGAIHSFEDLLSRFSIEVVNNEFYKEIAKLYDNLVGTNQKKGCLKYPGDVEAQHGFAVRLIGRIIFCWFLREKKSNQDISLLPTEILSREAADKVNYYHSTLTPLFFEVLNKPINERKQEFKRGQYKLVPFLNGGLFQPSPDDYYGDDDSGVVPTGTISVPDSWLHQLFDLLEIYNFTVDENTSYDVDLSIDPEMLGRIFENLLARINPETGETVRKKTGSFYTPREVVEYMVDESLKYYLLTKTKIHEDKIKAVISYDLLDDQEYPLTSQEKETIAHALASVKILDPACGSGAFPMGVLQKVVFILQQVDPDAKTWVEQQSKHAGPELRSHLEKEFEAKSFDYLRKLSIIRASIYGVDIQPIATEISRLRCFLTLIVDQSIKDAEDNRGIEPLPNLDFKFVCADSLVALSNVGSLGSDMNLSEKLRIIMDQYFQTRSLVKKLSLERDYQKLISSQQTALDGKRIEQLKSFNPFTNDTPASFFDTNQMFGLTGFDIVIGNPPYVQLQKNEGELAQRYKTEDFDSFASRGDIYQLFYERGISFLNEAGALCYITSNKWMRAAYGREMRKLLAKQTDVLQLIDMGPGVFEATVDTNIIIFKKRQVVEPTVATALTMTDEDELTYEHIIDKGTRFEAPNDGGSWLILNPIEQSIKQKIEKIGTPLKDWDIDIYRGILTGYNKAFIIDNETKERLVAEDPRSIAIIKPILRGRDIDRYQSHHCGSYILLIGHGNHEFLSERYPAVHRHLLQFERELKNRGQCKYSRGSRAGGTNYEGQHHWLELDNNPSPEYFAEFEKPKVVWQRITQRPTFCLSPPGQYILDSMAFLTAEISVLNFLLSLLNSTVVEFWVYHNVHRYGNTGYRLSNQYVKLLPLPTINQCNRSLVNQLTQLMRNPVGTLDDNDMLSLQQKVNALVYQLYGLDSDEIQVIEDLV